MRDLDTANQLTSFVFHPINYLWYDFDRDGSETWAMPTQLFFSSGKRQRLYFELSYIKMCPSKWGWWKIALSTLLPHVYVTNCVYPHVGECVNVLFLLRGIVHAVTSSHQVQCLSVDNWVKIPPINVGVCHKSTQSKQCPGWWPGVGPVPADQSAATIRADWPMGGGTGGWGVVMVHPLSCHARLLCMFVTLSSHVMTKELKICLWGT